VRRKQNIFDEKKCVAGKTDGLHKAQLKIFVLEFISELIH